MNMVSVAVLKARLSHYLRLVAQGEEVVVTSHREKVARILPLEDQKLRLRPPSRPVADLRRVKGLRARRSVSAVEELIRERRSR